MTTSGPRPLRLALSAESPTITSPSPLTPHSAGSKRNLGFRTNPRRQSSISYRHSRDGPLSPVATPISAPDSPGLTSKPNLSRSASVGSRASRSVDETSPNLYSRKAPSTPITPGGKGSRNSTGSLLSEEKERPPLTLVEKHAELLHFIAQKESKCLELRTQLRSHEAELLQLKKKWERIVFRGFEKSQAQPEDTPPSSAYPSSDSLPSASVTHPPSASIYSAASLSYLDSLSTQAQGAGGAAMLEALGGMKGIRESVQQGVGRFLGAVAGTNDGSSSHRRPLTHAPSLSSSSASTHATSSTRLSQSSQSSFGASISEEDDEPSSMTPSMKPSTKSKPRKNKPKMNIDIVSDTGATPLVSPTTDFTFEDPPHTATPASASANVTTGNIRSRRKSRVFSDETGSEELTSDTNTSESLSTSLIDWGMGLSSPTLDPMATSPRSGMQVLGMSNGNENSRANKRMSLPARSFSSSTDNGMSWMGSMVGKRLEDAISKNQKRASVLLTDVSQSISQSLNPQSIIQALVSPPSNSSADQVSERYQNDSPPTSLLDEDVPPLAEVQSRGALTPLLEPAVLSPTKLMEPKPKSPMQNQAEAAGEEKAGKGETSASTPDDDDDDWNW